MVAKLHRLVKDSSGNQPEREERTEQTMASPLHRRPLLLRRTLAVERTANGVEHEDQSKVD